MLALSIHGLCKNFLGMNQNVPSVKNGAATDVLVAVEM